MLRSKTREKYGRRLTIIACGGVFTAQDAMEKLEAGADLVQLITGMIFEGPHLMKSIARAHAEAKLGQLPAKGAVHQARG